MRFYDYEERERDGKSAIYGSEEAAREGWPDQLIRERRRGRDEFVIMRDGYHFHKFGFAKPRGEVALRRKTEYCSDCPFELVIAYPATGGEPIRLTLTHDAAVYVAAEREIAEARARDMAAIVEARAKDLAALDGEPRVSCAQA